MRSIFAILLLIAIALPVQADDDFKLQLGRRANPFNPARTGESPIRNNAAYQDYLARRAERRYVALQLRLEYNLSKGPAVYYRYNPNALPVFWSAIQQGWVQQPPIPRPAYRVRLAPRIAYVPSNSD